MAITVKHKFVSAIPDAGDTTIVQPSNWNDSHDLTGTVPIANGGTNATTAADGLNNLLPSQTGNNGKVLATDGTNASWTTNGSGDVVGPASATDNAVARFDTTTGKLIQNSVTTIDDTGNASGILSQQFSNGSAVTLAAGKIWYDGSTGSWNAGMGGGNITQQIGEELFIYGKASAAITDSPLQIVYHTGTVGASGVITFAPTIAGITDENAIVGVATENIALNGFGRVTTFGLVRGITTNGTAFGETWADDDVIWYNPVTGNPTNIKPSAPNIKFQIGLVVKAGAGGSGSFQVALVQGTQLGGTDSNVKLTSPANGNILTYDGGNGYWKNTDLTAGTGISVSKSTNGVLTVTNTSPSSGGTVTSVAATVPSFLSVSGSPITTSGTLAFTYSGTALPILNGGTGATTASTAFNALSPLTTAGDTLYGGTSGAGTRLAIGTAGQVLTVNAGATAPQWSTPTAGTVTAVSVASANGFAGTSSGGATPALTLSTSITGVLKGNATAISAATAGTDYSAGTSANTSGLVYSTTTTGALTTATGAQVSTALGTTAISGNAANVTGIVVGANGGTGVANTGSTITIAGNLTHAGAFTQSFTATGNTAVTLPTSGTLISTVTNMAANPVTGTPSSSNFLRGDGTWASPTAGLSSYVRTNFTATAGQTSFTVAYTVGFVQVYVNGVLLDTTDYTSTSGTAIVLATAAALNDIVTVIAYSVTTATAAAGSDTQVQYNSSGSFAGSSNLTFNGTTLTGAFSGAHNGTVGATTPNTGKFTTITQSAGTAAAGGAPIYLTSGTNLTSAVAGAVEYDGNNFYVTPDTSQGRNVNLTAQQFYLSSAVTAFGPASGNFFGSTSAASLAASSTYDIECYCYFLKTTAGTSQWIPTFSTAVTIGHSYLEYTPVTGFTTSVITGAMVVSEATQQTTTVLTHTASAALTTAVYHIAKLRIRVTTNTACNFRLNFVGSAGTITPQIGSFYTVRKVIINAGNFVA